MLSSQYWGKKDTKSIEKIDGDRSSVFGGRFYAVFCICLFLPPVCDDGVYE